MQRCFKNIVAGISLSSLLVGAFLLTAPLRADDLTDAIDRVTQTSEALLSAQKKEKAIVSIRNGLRYDTLEALLRQGVTAKKEDIENYFNSRRRNGRMDKVPPFN